MRIKSHWFKPGADKSPADHASAMAFIVWRVAHGLAHSGRDGDEAVGMPKILGVGLPRMGLLQTFVTLACGS